MKTIFLSILLVVSASVQAAWTKLPGEGSDMDLYIDYSTVKSRNGLVRAWFVYDFHKPQYDGLVPFWSGTRLDEFDCKEERMRNFSVLTYSERMGHGRLVRSYNFEKPEWLYIAPNTIGQNQMIFLCGH